jgi:hypothetical protein
MIGRPVKIILDDLRFLLIEVLIIIVEVKLWVALIARFVMTFTVYNFNIGMIMRDGAVNKRFGAMMDKALGRIHEQDNFVGINIV